jgi:hypothetical protein
MKRLLSLAVILSIPFLTAEADEPSQSGELDLKALLGRSVFDPSIPLNEVQTFCEARVIRMPHVGSVAEWERHAKQIRERTLKQVVFRGEAAKWRDAKTKVVWLETIEGGDGYRIRKLRYEAIPGLWVPALLYEPTKLKGKMPVVLNVNGHDSKGKAAKYKQIRCINQAKRGMLALNVEWFGMGQLRKPGFVHYRLNQIDLCGSSGVSVFFLAMKRGLDVLLAHKNADPSRVAVAGLSGGGWQTIFISSLDERVTLSNPVAGYSSFRTRARITPDLGDSEQTPVDLAAVGDYALLTAIRAPKPTLLTNNVKDNCCFKAETTLPPLVEAAAPIYALYGKSRNLRTHVNHVPGTHNFELDNRQALYRMLGDFFYGRRRTLTVRLDANKLRLLGVTAQQAAKAVADAGVANGQWQWKSGGLDEVRQIVITRRNNAPIRLRDVAEVQVVEIKAQPFDPKEIPCDDEVKTKQELEVALPENNLDFHQVAMNLSRNLPAADINGSTKSELARQQADGRKRLKEVLRAKPQAIHAIREKNETHGDTKVTYWWLRIGGEWTVPGTEFVRGKPKATVIVVADAGRASTAETVNKLLDAGNRVLAVDPFAFGESKIAKRGFLYGLLISSVGERPLGVQAGQLAAIAGWLKKRDRKTPVTVTAVGPRTSLIAVCAAGLDGKTIDGLDLHQSYASLKEVLEQDVTVNKQPELFCFGLLEQFDVKQLATLVAPRPVRFHAATPRHQKELAGLKAAYKTLGKAFEPLK